MSEHEDTGSDLSDGGPALEEIDVSGEQGPVDWSKQPSSDKGMTPEAREQLGG